MQVAATTLGAAALFLATTVSEAGAKEEEALRVNYVADGILIGAAFLAAYLIKNLPSADTSSRWKSEVFGPIDERVKSNFSAKAARISDITLMTSIAAPYPLLFSDGFDEAAAKRAIVYTEVLALNVIPTAIAKVLVERPRPYAYSKAPAAIALVEHEGGDSHRSFYSGHSSTTFAAAVASSTLYARESDNKAAKIAAWGVQMAFASATANLRVRAGRHFYSDVAVGAVLGSALAYSVVALHAEGDRFYRPSGGEVAAIGGGIALGALVTELIPFGSAKEEGDGPTLAPIAVRGGLGFALIVVH